MRVFAYQTKARRADAEGAAHSLPPARIVRIQSLRDRMRNAARIP